MTTRGQPTFLGPITPTFVDGVTSRKFSWFCGAHRHEVVVPCGEDQSAVDVRRRMSQAPDRFIVKDQGLFEAIWKAVTGEL